MGYTITVRIGILGLIVIGAVVRPFQRKKHTLASASPTNGKADSA